MLIKNGGESWQYDKDRARLFLEWNYKKNKWQLVLFCRDTEYTIHEGVDCDVMIYILADITSEADGGSKEFSIDDWITHWLIDTESSNLLFDNEWNWDEDDDGI